MKKLKVDADGVFCPRCGGRQFQKRGSLAWNPGRPECLACGHVFQPASKGDLKRASQLRLAAATAAKASPPPSPPGVISVADELTKLIALRDAGALSSEEFETQRAKLLGNA